MFKLRKLIKLLIEKTENNTAIFNEGTISKKEFIFELMSTDFFSKTEKKEFSMDKKMNYISKLIKYALQKGYICQPTEFSDQITYTEDGKRLLNWVYFFEAFLKDISNIKTVLLTVIFSSSFWIVIPDIIQWFRQSVIFISN